MHLAAKVRVFAATANYTTSKHYDLTLLLLQPKCFRVGCRESFLKGPSSLSASTNRALICWPTIPERGVQHMLDKFALQERRLLWYVYSSHKLPVYTVWVDSWPDYIQNQTPCTPITFKIAPKQTREWLTSQPCRLFRQNTSSQKRRCVNGHRFYDSFMCSAKLEKFKVLNIMVLFLIAHFVWWNVFVRKGLNLMHWLKTVQQHVPGLHLQICRQHHQFRKITFSKWNVSLRKVSLS